MVAANVRENKLTVANVGDSRCYLIRSGKVTQISQDHNFVGELVRNGSLSLTKPKRKSSQYLLRSLGGEPDVEVDIFGSLIFSRRHHPPLQRRPDKIRKRCGHFADLL